MMNALSIDLEEWFAVSNFEGVIRREDWAELESRIEDSTERILALLEQRRTRATFFILGWVAERHPDLVRQIFSKGHEIASHGYGHQLVYNLSPDQFRADLNRSMELLRGITGVSPAGYRAPSFSLRRDMTWAWKIMAESGLRYDSSIFPVVHDRYGEPDAPRFPFKIQTGGEGIMEFPLSTIRLFGANVPVAGGGYLRLFPYGITSWAIRRINREGHPAVVFLHPWELDPDQPRPAVPRLRLVRHRIGMRSMERKLDRLIQDFQFAPLREVLGMA